MRKRKTAAALTAALAFLAINAGITSSSAATVRTWTVTPGGNATAKSGVIMLTDTKTRRAGKCASSKVTGKLKSGTKLPGKDIGSVRSAAFSACTGPAGVPFTVTAIGLPWQINVTSYNPATGVVSGTVSHIRVIVSGKFCRAVVNGTGTTKADGVIKATYSNRTGLLKFLATGGNLHFWHVSDGCVPLLNSSDPAAFTAAYTISRHQVITSP